MTTDYDPIAEQYKRSKQTPWRAHIECFTLLEIIGPVDRQSVLDVACGEGFYTRLLRHRGAGEITGVDLSEGMVALARRQEMESPLGIEYLVGDGKDLQVSEDYDLVVAAYLLNYAATAEDLAAMCRSIARCLKPGGRFVTVNCNPALDFRAAPSYRRYGFETSVDGEWRDGAPIKWTFFLDDGPFSIENYYLPVSVHEQVLRDAGFREIRWHPPRLAPPGEVEHGQAFWEPFLRSSPVAFIECVK